MENDPANLHSLSLASLACLCAQQTALFYRGRENDTSFCFEIFRRAILEKDETAWESIHQLYRDQIIRWVHRHPSFGSTDEEEQYFVNGALEKLWQAVKPERFAQFPDLKRLLSYLQLCVHSVITDYLRARAENMLVVDMEKAEDIPEPVSIEEQMLARSDAQALWKMVIERLRDGKEVQVAYDSFVLGLKPADMMVRTPGSYENIKEIYRIKENILDRLHRDPEFLDLQND